MSVEKERFIKKSKRKAEKLHKRFNKGNLEAAKYLISNNPLFTKEQPSDLIKKTFKRSVFLHAVAQENGFSKWNDLIDANTDKTE